MASFEEKDSDWFATVLFALAETVIDVGELMAVIVPLMFVPLTDMPTKRSAVVAKLVMLLLAFVTLPVRMTPNCTIGVTLEASDLPIEFVPPTARIAPENI